MASRWVKNYFHFPAREKWALLIMLTVTGGLFLLPVLIKGKATFITTEEMAGSTQAEKSWFDLDSLQDNTGEKFGRREAMEARLFRFDPNTVSEEDLLSLGVPQKAAQTWINYRNKGGKFRSASDLRKLYTLSDAMKQRLIPYAYVAAASAGDYAHSYPEKDTGNYPSGRDRKYRSIDINTATEADWEQLPMIGSYLAGRIVKFRAARQGFTSVEQVGETYGLRPESFEVIRPFLKMESAPGTKPEAKSDLARILNKRDINTAGREQLLKCPAITEAIATAIIIQRNNRGPFERKSDLKRIVFLQPDQLESISVWFGLEDD